MIVRNQNVNNLFNTQIVALIQTFIIKENFTKIEPKIILALYDLQLPKIKLHFDKILTQHILNLTIRLFIEYGSQNFWCSRCQTLIEVLIRISIRISKNRMAELQYPHSDHAYQTKRTEPLEEIHSYSIESNHAQIVEDQASNPEYGSIKSEQVYQQKETMKPAAVKTQIAVETASNTPFLLPSSWMPSSSNGGK